MRNGPSARQVMEIAQSLGIHLDEDEAALYQIEATEKLQIFHQFLQSRLPVDYPPLAFPERAIGYGPTPSEDPHQAWLWKCRLGGKDRGLLAGKDVSFKDHVSVAGIPQCLNSSAMRNFIPDFDATIVTRVLEAGGRVVGKNAMNGFMEDFPKPLNPHNPGHVTGGSSSGSAVAVAARETDISFGGDQGGSLRIPAAYCGVVGLKPTFGLVSHFGVSFAFEQSVDHVGPMALRVEDVAAALEAVAGFDGYDPRQGREVPENFDVLRHLTDGVEGIRIGVLQEGFDEPIEASLRDGVLEAVEVLARAGAKVTEVSIPEHRGINRIYEALIVEGSKAVIDTGLHGVWSKTYYPPGLLTAFDTMWRESADMFPPHIKLDHIVAALSRREYHGAVYAKAHNVRPAIIRAYDSALAQVDVLALPTVRSVAPPVEAQPTGRLAALKANLRRSNWPFLPYTYNTLPSDYTGHPALTIPCGKLTGLPIGLQLIGRFFEDMTLLRTAYAYQESVDWDRLTRIER